MTDPDGESCRVTPECKDHKYEFQPAPGQTFVRWQVRGDLKLLSPEDQNPGVVCSVGYGKGRITAHYYTLGKSTEKCRRECPDTTYHTLDYDLFKFFKAPDPLHGPPCVRGGQEVTYWVPPILTDWPRRSAGIGTDGYFWSGFPAGSVLHFSGDSSSVTVQLPDYLPSGFTVAVQVGRCNKRNTITRKVERGYELASTVSGPSCQSTADGTKLAITIATVAGIQYSVSLPVGWRFVTGSTGTLVGNGQSQTVEFQLGPTMGNVMLSATGGCDSPQLLGWSFTANP